MSIKSKITLSAVLVIFSFGVIATFFVFNQTRNKLISLEENNLKIIAKEHSGILVEVFDDTWQLITKISSLPDIKNYVADQGHLLQDPDIVQILHDYNLGDNYSAIYIMDKDGLTLASTAESFVGKNYSFRGYFRESMKGNKFVDIAVGVTSGELGYYFSTPIETESGQILGVIVAKLRPAYINSTLTVETDELYDMGKIELMLVEDSGVIIYSDEKMKMYTSLGEMTEQQKDKIKTNKKFTNKDILPLEYNEIQLGLDEIRKTKAFNIWDDFDFEQKIVILTPVGDLPFFLLAETGQEEISKSALRISMLLAGFVLLAALFAIVVIYFLVARILNPLKDLQKTADEISKGNLEERVDIDSEGELKELGESFNKMTDKLVKTQKNIEKKVKERTGALEKINKSMVGRELKMAELKEKIKYLEKEIKNKK